MIVISNGMLRSGSTLQYNVAASVLETAGPLKRAGFLGDLLEPNNRSKLEAMKSASSWTIIKTHEAPLERAFYDDNVRVLFSYRDVRDIAASIKKKWGDPFEKILANIDAMIAIDRAFSNIPNVLIQSYDMLYNHPHVATKEIAGFLEVSLSEADVECIVRENSIAKLAGKKNSTTDVVAGIKRLLGRRAYDQHTLIHTDHISATGGKEGDWMNQFTKAEIATLSERFKDWFDARGYKHSTSQNL